jgi:integrase
MIIQFSRIDYQDIEVAKLSAWLSEVDLKTIPNDVPELSRRTGINEETLRNNTKIQETIRNRTDQISSKSFRTPLSDWYEIPFLIDRNEKPVTAANAWIRHISKRGSPKTWRTYAYALFDFLQYLEAHSIVWQEADDDILLSYRLYLETTDSDHKKKRWGSRRVSRNTIQMRLLIAVRFYKYAALHRYIEKNLLTFQTVQVRRPANVNFLAHLNRSQQKEISIVAYEHLSRNEVVKWLPHETVWRWISSIKNERDKLIAKLLYQTGMRREEIILWKVSDIPESKYSQDHPSPDWIQFPIRGKGGKTRLIRISIKNFLTLRHWIDFDRKKILKKCGITKAKDHGFVWISIKVGHPLQPITLNHLFQRVSKKCGIYITPHMLRHSFAMEKRVDLYADGVPNPEKVLQVTLGHSSVVTTMSIYGHISPEYEAKEAESNAALIKRLIPEDTNVSPNA